MLISYRFKFLFGFLVIIMLMICACTELGVPSPQGFMDLSEPLVYSLPGSGEYAHDGVLYTNSKNRYFYVVFDWTQAKIAQYSEFSSPSIIRSEFGVYSPYSNSWYFSDIYSGRFAAISAENGMNRTAVILPTRTMTRLGNFCTKQGYLWVESAQYETDGAGYRVAIIDTKTDTIVRDDIFLPEYVNGLAYDGESTVYWYHPPVDGRSGVSDVYYAMDLTSFTVQEIWSKADDNAGGPTKCFNGDFFFGRTAGMNGSYLDNTDGELIRYDPETKTAKELSFTLSGTDYGFWSFFLYLNELYLIIRQNYNYDGTPFNIDIYKYLADSDSFELVNDTALDSVLFRGDVYVRDNKLIVSYAYYAEGDDDESRKFSQYRIAIVNLDTWEKEFDQVIWPY